MPTRIAVLASGRGSNLRALLDHLDARGARRGGDVVLVASDRADAGALELAGQRGIATEHLVPGDERSLAETLSRHRAELIVLAGYLRLVPESIVRAYPGRILNVHPALLPAFGGVGMYGERVHRAVLASGSRVSGVTVHFVDESYDRGAIAAQWPVPVFPDDTPHALAARVLRAEHRLLPRVVDAVAAGRLRLIDGHAVGFASRGTPDAAFLLSAADDAALSGAMDSALAC
jgi:formyltetrahydrofolate-dependent phosphoribosylglycinamide formyltransferase